MYTVIEDEEAKPFRRLSFASVKGESRKQKHSTAGGLEDQIVSDENGNPNAMITKADKTTTTTTHSRTDNDKINSIVTHDLWSDEYQDVAMAMHSLRKLVDRCSNLNYDENRKTAFRRGGHLAIVQAMIRNASSFAIQCDGCLVLMRISLCGLDDARRDIIEIGGIKCCRRALEQFPEKSSVQTAGCKLIRNLWITPDVRRSVVTGGGLTIVLNAMDKLKTDRNVQNNGCKALFALLCDESTWAKKAVDAGCIEVVIAAMENCPHDADLQVYGCKFLIALAQISQDYCCGRIIDAKGLVAVVEAKRIHPEDERVLSEVRRAVQAIGI
jgi:hypothetical protein